MIAFLILLVLITGYMVCAEIVFERDWPRCTIKGFIIALALLFMGFQAFGQASRFDQVVSTINASAPAPGGLYPALYIPGSGINICNAPANAVPCTNYATTYTNAAQSATCTAPTQLTRPGANICVKGADEEGGWGVWMTSGNYQYTITTTYGSFGPYDFSVGGVSGGGVVPATQDLLGRYTSNGLNIQGSGVSVDHATGSNLTVPGTGIVQGAFTAASSAVAGDYTPMYFGAKGDEQEVTDGNVSTSGTDLTTTSSTPFTAGDVGKAIVITGAGTQFSTIKNFYGNQIPTAFATTIQSFISSNHVVLAASVPLGVTNSLVQWGTDDFAAVKACVVAAGSTLNGRCTINNDKKFMESNTGNMIISIASGTTIDGKGTLVYAPQGTIVAGTNNAQFVAASSQSSVFQIAAPIAIGATSFTATNSGDAATIIPGGWVGIQETDSVVHDVVYYTVVQVAGVSGTTVNLMNGVDTSFPDTHTWVAPGTSGGLGWRNITNINQNTTIRDIKMIVPFLTASGRSIYTVDESGAFGFTLDHVDCINSGYSCGEFIYGYKNKVTNNVFEISHIEVAHEMHMDIEGNKFDKIALPINNYLSACASGVSQSGIELDLGTGWLTMTGNNFPNACGYGVQLFFGVHDTSIHNNTFGWIQGSPGSENNGFGIGGSYNNNLANNVLAGSDGSASNIASVGDSAGNPGITSVNNIYGPQQANLTTLSTMPFQGTAYRNTSAGPGNVYDFQSPSSTTHNWPFPQNMSNGNTFGTTANNYQTLGGQASNGIGWIFGNVGESDAVQSLFSNAGIAMVQNAKQTTPSVDGWTQTSAGQISGVLAITPGIGMEYRTAPVSSSPNPYSSFFTNQDFFVNPFTQNSGVGGSILRFSAPQFISTGLSGSSGNCVQIGTGGSFVAASGACGGSGTFNALTGDATSTSTGGATEVVGLLNNVLPSLTAGFLNWTGSAWALSAGGSGITSLTPSAYGSVGGSVGTLKTQRGVNAVVDWGLDNTGGSDIGATINTKCAAYSTSTTQPEVFFPAGTYLVTTPIACTGSSTTVNNLSFIGEGRASRNGNGTVTFLCNVPNSTCLWLDNTTASTGNDHGPRLEHLTLVDTSSSKNDFALLRITQYNSIYVNDVSTQASVGTQYSTGTVSISNGSTALTGAGTTFPSGIQFGHLQIGGNFQEVASQSSGTAATLTSNWQYTTAAGATYAINYGGIGFLIEGTSATGFTQYGTVVNYSGTGDRVCLDFGGGPTSSSGTSRIHFYGGFCNGARVADSIGVFAGKFADTHKIDFAINNVARGFISESAHALVFEGELENTGTFTVVTTCNSGVAAQSCTKGVVLNADATTTGHDTRILGGYIYTWGTGISVDSANVTTGQIDSVAMRGNTTTNYSWSDASTGCSTTQANAAVFQTDCVTSQSAMSAPSATFTGSGIPISTGTTSNTDLAGSVTLSGGTGTYTFSATYVTTPICTATDTTTAAAVKTSASTTVLTITGTGTDVVNYICIGRT